MYDAVEELSKQRVGSLLAQHGTMQAAAVSASTSSHYLLMRIDIRCNRTCLVCSPGCASWPFIPACFLLTIFSSWKAAVNPTTVTLRPLYRSLPKSAFVCRTCLHRASRTARSVQSASASSTSPGLLSADTCSASLGGSISTLSQPIAKFYDS